MDKADMRFGGEGGLTNQNTKRKSNKIDSDNLRFTKTQNSSRVTKLQCIAAVNSQMQPLRRRCVCVCVSETDTGRITRPRCICLFSHAETAGMWHGLHIYFRVDATQCGNNKKIKGLSVHLLSLPPLYSMMWYVLNGPFL